MTQLRSGLPLALAAALACGPILLTAPRVGWSQIEEVIVTTRKREENVQNVPISITAIGADEIERKSIQNVTDIAKQSASIDFDEGSSQSDTRITIRGLSPTRGRQNVAVLVDGIDVSTEAISSSGGGILLNSKLIDVQRIEVVKGPQMVLYGRSAFNGAIQYITKDPSDVFESKVGLDVNDQSQYSGTLSLSGPVFGDKLGLRLNATAWNEDGFYKNSITGARLGDDEGYGLALTAKSQVTDSLSFKFRAEYQDQQQAPSPTVFLKFNSQVEVPLEARTPLAGTNPGDPQFPALFRCYQDLVQKVLTADPFQGRDPAVFMAHDTRLFDPAYLNAPGFDRAAFDLYNTSYCETRVAAFTGGVPDVNPQDIAVAPNPFTGKDSPGIDRQLTRLSLVGEWELPKGMLTSRTGYIHEDASEEQDSGKYAFLNDAGEVGNANSFFFSNHKLTEQFSQELTFRTAYDGPVNVTVGGLYWQENVKNDSNSLTIQGSGSHCAWSSSSVNGDTFYDMGLWPDEGSACPGYTELPVAPLMRGGFNFGDGTAYDGIEQYKNPSPANRDTEHRSMFGSAEIKFDPDWTMILEGRYSTETVKVTGPVFLNPLASGGPGGWQPCGIFFRPCNSAWLFGPLGPFYSQANFEAAYDKFNPNAPLTTDADIPNSLLFRDVIPEVCRNDPAVVARLANVDAGNPDPFDLFNPYCVSNIKRDDTWFTPKLTLDWQINDEASAYFSWSKAEKPGGFTTLTIGSNGLNREVSEFEPEQMQVWELGAKTRWLDGSLIVNGDLFFQDFSSKQTLISVPSADGTRLVSKIANLCCAEVWGAELDLQWAPLTPFLGGNWALSGSYTYLDTQYLGAKTENTSFTTISGAGNCTPFGVVTNGADNNGDGIPDDTYGPDTNGDGNPDSGTPDGVPDTTRRIVCVVNFDGNELEDAPKGKFVGSAKYTFPVTGEMDLIAEVDYRWSDKRYIEATNDNWVEAYSETDVRLGLQSGRWEVIGYVSNVFEDKTVRSSLGGPGLSCCFILGSGVDVALDSPAPDKTVTVEQPAFRAAFVPDPRIFGLRFKYSFGGGE